MADSNLSGISGLGNLNLQFLPNQTTLPTFQTPSVDYIGQNITDYSALLNQLPIAGGTSDATALNQRNQQLLADYLTQPRSKEAILAEQEAFFGDDVARDAKTQAFLALAKYGSEVAQTPGSLLQALVAPAGEFAKDLSKVAGAKSAAERKAKEFAYSTERAEREAERGQKLTSAMNAISEPAQNGRSINATKNNFLMTLAKEGIQAAAADTKAINDAIYRNWAQNQVFAGMKPIKFAKKDATSGLFTDLKDGYRTADGIFTYDDSSGNFVKMPEGYQSVPDATATSILKSLASVGKIDDAQRTSFVVPDSTAEFGFKQVNGFFSPTYGFYTTSDGSFDATKIERLPDGWIEGALKDVVQVSEKSDQAGRIHVTVKRPDGSTDTFLSKVTVPGQIDPKIAVDENGNTVVDFPVAYQLQAPVYKINDADQRVLSSGNPMVREVTPSGMNIGNMSAADLAFTSKKILLGTETLRAGEKLLEGMQHIIGPTGTIKSFATNNLSAFLPENFAEGLLQHFKNNTYIEQLKTFERKLVAAELLSQKAAVTEQQIISELAPKLDFFQNPEAAIVSFQELLRKTQNDLMINRNVIDPRLPALQIDRIPTGTPNDPFIFRQIGHPNPMQHYDYLSQLANRGLDISDLILRMTGNEAKALGLPEDAYMRDGQIAPSVTLKMKSLLTRGN